MLHVSQVRGAQSGGGALMLRLDGVDRQAIHKSINSKRGSLAARMTDLLEGQARRGQPSESFLVQTHVRFATSGPATQRESHPHRFVEAKERGPRRVFRVDELESAPAVRPIETAITHNGDMDALCFRGVRLAYPDLSGFLEHVLWTKNELVGDSPLLAGVFELFLTQGLWLESLRLAYLEIVAEPPPDVTGRASALSGVERAQQVRHLLSQHYPVLSMSALQRMAAVGEQVWLATAPGPKARLTQRSDLTHRLSRALQAEVSGELRVLRNEPLCDLFARRALDAFLDNDLYHAARLVEASSEGTFGCVVTSTLEPDTAVAFARGQPLSIGVQSASGTVAIASERNALRVCDDGGRPLFDARLDFELGSAEIARVKVRTTGQPQLSLYNVAAGRNFSRSELEVSGRLVALRDNPLITPLPHEGAGRVRADLLDTPEILRKARASFADPGAYNHRSATAFASALLEHPTPRLLVIGITTDLWLGEQFTRNLRLCFPNIPCEARSSNDVLKEQADTPLPEGTVVLAISQSGQDFPTLAALYHLRLRAGESGAERLFVLTGELDTLMGQVVHQSYARKAPWLGRVFCNSGGYRPSEAATASVSATHATLCELTLFLCERALHSEHRHLLAIDAQDLRALCLRRDDSVDRHAADIVHAEGSRLSEVAQRIAKHGRRFSWHVLEGIVGFIGAAGVLQANLQLGVPLRPSGLIGLLGDLHAQGWPTTLLRSFATQLDVIFYLLLAPGIVWLLRLAQGRPMWHRQGTRELLIGDTPYVSRIVWLLSRRLFSLSYGFASIKPYAADNQDDLILTHEPLRGTLAVLGIPDARRPHLASHGAAAAMTAKQFSSSRSFAGSGAEVVTLGSGRSGPAPGAHLPLPRASITRSNRVLDLLVEGMFDSWERLLAMQVLVTRMAESIAAFYPLAYDPSRTKDQVFAPTTAAPVSAASFFGLAGVARVVRFSRVSLPFDLIERSFAERRSRVSQDEARLSVLPAPLTAPPMLERPSLVPAAPVPVVPVAPAAPAAAPSVAVLHSVPIGSVTQTASKRAERL